MKKILVVSQYFYPEQFRINDICLELKKRGYDVTVLTGIPNYPFGKFYSGYGLFRRKVDEWNGIKIIRLPIISRGHSSFRLFLNYYSFVVSGFFWSFFTRKKFDLVFTFEVSPIMQALIGKWYAKRRKIKNYLYVQDLWPENLEIIGGVKNKIILKHYSRLATRIYKSNTKIFVTSPSFKATLEERVDDCEKIIYLPQYAEDHYKPKYLLNKDNNKFDFLDNDNRFKIVFTGNIGYAQGLDILPRIAKSLGDIVFVIVGDGRYRNQFEKEIACFKNNFYFLGQIDSLDVPYVLSKCNLAFISFLNNQLFSKTIPAKLQTYLACAMPIIGYASGETKRIIEEAKCGYCCEIGNEKELISTINQLVKIDLTSMSKNSLLYSKKHFDKDRIIEKLIKEIE